MLPSVQGVVLDPAVRCAGDALLTGFLEGFWQFIVRQDGKTERTAATFALAAHPKIAAVGSNDGLAEVETQTGAANLGAVAVVTVELCEQIGQNAWRYTQAEVLDGRLDQAVTAQMSLDVDVMAFAAVLNGIINQIVNDLTDAELVDSDWREILIDA